MDQFRGRVAVVTGAASGIGRGMVDAFAAAGMKVVLADVQEGPLRHAERDLVDAGADVLPVPTDVADPDAVARLRDAALERFGAVQVLCNNAGVGGFARVETLTVDHWQWVLGVSLWGVVNGLIAFLPTLLPQDAAHVVNTASFGGFFPTRGSLPTERPRLRSSRCRSRSTWSSGTQGAGSVSPSCAPVRSTPRSPTTSATSRPAWCRARSWTRHPRWSLGERATR